MQQHLESKYGLFMTVENLAELSKTHRQTIYNKLYKGTLDIPYWKMGRNYLFSTQAVAEHITQQSKDYEKEQPKRV